MVGVINTFNHDTGHGTIQTEDGTQYFFSYSECFTPPDELYATGLPVEFDLRYVGDMPIAYNLDEANYNGGFN
jgi:cold shock CspA family protein